MSNLESRSQIDIAIERLLRRDSISRRTFMRRAGRGGVVLGAALSLPSLLGACAPGTSSGAKALQWANWPAYIDIDEETTPDPTKYPSINTFIKQTSVDVNYQEVIQDNADFLGQIRQDLAAGNPTGWDVITPGGWVIERMGRLGYLEELDQSKLPNWTANAADYAKRLWFDPDNKYSLWWQGGITGIAYDPELTGREITTFDDLLDPAFKERAGGFSDMRDMFGLTLLSLGVQPENATVADVTRAQKKLLDANARQQFRGYYGNEYYDALSVGDLAISVAWSGDISQMQLYDNPKVKFVIPDGGGMRWNDNLAIPKKAAQIDNAHKLLNYWYDPVAATTLSEYIGYFTPVKGVSERIKADAAALRLPGPSASPDVATADLYDTLAPTVVPTADQLAGTYPDKQLDEAEEAQWNDLFLKVLGG